MPGSVHPISAPQHHIAAAAAAMVRVLGGGDCETILSLQWGNHSLSLRHVVCCGHRCSAAISAPLHRSQVRVIILHMVQLPVDSGALLLVGLAFEIRQADAQRFHFGFDVGNARVIV